MTTSDSSMVIGLEVCEIYSDLEMDVALKQALSDGIINQDEYNLAYFFWFKVR